MTADIPVSIDTAAAWSGNTRTLISTGFSGADTAPVITVGAETLAVRAAGTGTVVVTLPDTSGGIQPVIHWTNGSTSAPGDIAVYGFAGWTTGPMVAGQIIAWPADGTRSTFLAFVGNSVSQFDAGEGTLQALLSVTAPEHHCLPAPVEAADPGLLVVSSYDSATRTCSPAVAMPVPGSTAAPDTGPVPPQPYPMVQIGRGRWLKSLKQGFQVLTRQANGTFASSFSFSLCSQPFGFAVSPKRDRVIPIGLCTSIGLGIPVYDTTSTEPLDTIAAIYGDVGVAFSKLGDTIFAAGRHDSALVVALAASNGAVLNQTWLPQDNLFSISSMVIAAEPDRPWLYTISGPVWDGPGGSQIPAIAVFDRRTMARVASLQLPSGVRQPPSGLFQPMMALALDGPHRLLYLAVADFTVPSQMYVLRYSLVP